jgi:hypothetical protein
VIQNDITDKYMTLEKIDLENYRLDILRRESGTLVVSFEPMTPSQTNPSRDRLGWGAHFLDKRSEDVLYVKTTAPHWYRRADFYHWLDSNQSLFESYDRVVLMGGSMGGYGALAFAQAMRASAVLSLNPQSTLASDLAPWETRFSVGKREDWSGAYRDASVTSQGDVYVIADRYDTLDYNHIRRLKNCHYSNFPFVGHKIPAWLSQLNGMKAISSAVIDSNLPEEVMATISGVIRKRRKLEHWWINLLMTARRQNKEHLLKPFITLKLLDSLVDMKTDNERLLDLRNDLRDLAKSG